MAEPIDFECLQAHLDCAKKEKARQANGEKIEKDEWWAGVEYLETCEQLWLNAEELLRLARLGAAVEEGRNGTSQVNAGPIAICCMKEESRDLLDHMMTEYAKFKKLSDEETRDLNCYGFAYWLCRYSGIIAAITTEP